MTTTTTTRDRGDRYGPMEWAQQEESRGLSHEELLSLYAVQLKNFASMRPIGRIPRHRHPREDIGVGVDAGVVECGLNER